MDPPPRAPPTGAHAKPAAAVVSTAPGSAVSQTGASARPAAAGGTVTGPAWTPACSSSRSPGAAAATASASRPWGDPADPSPPADAAGPPTWRVRPVAGDQTGGVPPRVAVVALVVAAAAPSAPPPPTARTSTS